MRRRQQGEAAPRLATALPSFLTSAGVRLVYVHCWSQDEQRCTGRGNSTVELMQLYTSLLLAAAVAALSSLWWYLSVTTAELVGHHTNILYKCLLCSSEWVSLTSSSTDACFAAAMAGSAKFSTAPQRYVASLPRPQNAFEDRVDNSDAPFVPRLPPALLEVAGEAAAAAGVWLQFMYWLAVKTPPHSSWW